MNHKYSFTLRSRESFIQTTFLMVSISSSSIVWLTDMEHFNKVSLMSPSTNYPKCHLCHRHLLFDSRRVRAAPGGKWAHNLALLVANTGQPSQPPLRQGPAAITQGVVMLLMRESPHRRPARPWGVATQHQLNLSWQTIHVHALTHALIHKKTRADEHMKT